MFAWSIHRRECKYLGTYIWCLALPGWRPYCSPDVLRNAVLSREWSGPSLPLPLPFNFSSCLIINLLPHFPSPSLLSRSGCSSAAVVCTSPLPCSCIQCLVRRTVSTNCHWGINKWMTWHGSTFWIHVCLYLHIHLFSILFGKEAFIFPLACLFSLLHV